MVPGPLMNECVFVVQTVGEQEVEVRSAQEQASRTQMELARLRQELQDKASQEDTLRQQMADKEEKTRKAFGGVKQKISQLMGGNCVLPPLCPLGALLFPVDTFSP